MSDSANVNQSKSGRKTFRRRFVSGSLFVSPSKWNENRARFQVTEWVDIFANPVFKNPSDKCTEITKSNSKFVKDQWNVSHDSLIHACPLLVSSFGKKKNTFLGVIILIFFACALRHFRERSLEWRQASMLTLKYQAKRNTIAWKVFATLKRLDST